MKKFFDAVRYLNWWSITSVIFLLGMLVCLGDAAWPDKWAIPLGIVSVVAAIFALGDALPPTSPPDSKRRIEHEEAMRAKHTNR